jgi:hypothetical protein
VDFHVTAVQRYLSGWLSGRGDRSEDGLPNAALAPAREAIVDGLMRAIFERTVFPATALLLHVHDSAQNPSIIMALRAGLVGRQMRLDLRPLLVVEPEQICAHAAWLLNRLTKPLNQHIVN